MNLTEHIQDVNDNITAQRDEVSILCKERVVSIAIFAAMVLTVPQLAGWYLTIGVAATTLMGLRYLLVERSIFRKKELISQNEFYRDVIIQESYTGIEFGPSLA